jgi:OCT family organic cation transporter-like MFS transporter 4/5
MESPEDRNGNDVRQPLLEKIPVKKEAEGEERLCIDEMLQRYCGEFGRWQLKHFVLTCIAWALEAFHTMVMIFADQEPEWRCVGSDCRVGSLNCELDPSSWEWTAGKGSSTVSEWGLICGDKYKVGLVQALFFAGCMIGKFFFSLLYFFCDLGKLQKQ